MLGTQGQCFLDDGRGADRHGRRVRYWVGRSVSGGGLQAEKCWHRVVIYAGQRS